MSKHNILVVDDDKEITEAIEIYLLNEGYHVFKSYDGIQALKIAREEDIHLIIMDIMMPNLDGTRTTIELRKEKVKSEKITNVSHDFKTPLTFIINYISLLKEKNITDENRKRYLEVLDMKSKRLKILIEDLFEASKVVSGNMSLRGKN